MIKSTKIHGGLACNQYGYAALIKRMTVYAAKWKEMEI